MKCNPNPSNLNPFYSKFQLFFPEISVTNFSTEKKMENLSRLWLIWLWNGEERNFNTLKFGILLIFFVNKKNQITRLWFVRVSEFGGDGVVTRKVKLSVTRIRGEVFTPSNGRIPFLCQLTSLLNIFFLDILNILSFLWGYIRVIASFVRIYLFFFGDIQI